ncbi:Calmodulin [Brachionus plicatilis]|uniref:Calmodulin n=1 Tax=Brachionus plicatilis TaxID=10195 RepID=A0A3M7SQY0_BRAPC|nr:Calmodulin [Brachionus plicatilis]
MNQKLSQNQLKELKECFNLFDVDKSGSISVRELKKLCESLRIKVSDREANELMDLMDTDGSGSVDFKEFVNVMAEQFFREPTQGELEAAFDYFDKDKSGYISEEELLIAMSRFKGNIAKTDVQRMIQAVDKDRDNRINKQEFIDLNLICMWYVFMFLLLFFK